MQKRKTTYRQIEATSYIKKLMPEQQQVELIEFNSKDNDTKLKELEKQLSVIPSDIDNVTLEEAIVHAHYFTPKTDLFIIKKPFENSFYGIGIANKKVTNLELKRYYLFRILKSKTIKLNLNFKKDSLQNILKGLTKKTKTANQLIKETTYVKVLMPKMQQKALTQQNTDFSKSLVARLEKELSDVPKEPQGESIKKSMVYAHYFYGGSDWYITDISIKEKLMFGFVILNGDLQMAEAGYISIDEIVNNGKIELDFYFTKDTLENILHKKFPEEYPNPNGNTKKSQKKTVKKVMNVKMVDHFSTEYRLIRRFYNLIKSKKAVSFRRIQLMYMAFQKAALDRSVRKTNKVSDLYIQSNEKIVSLFDIVNPTKSDAKIDFTDKKLFEEIENYVTKQKVNYAIILLKSFVSIQGMQPERTKVNRLLKRINNAFEQKKVNKTNRLYDELVSAKLALESYLVSPEKKITPTQIGLSLPARSLCTNRIKCDGLRKDGKLHKGYKFIEGGDVVEVKKKAV